jgi:hypothetical protein
MILREYPWTPNHPEAVADSSRSESGRPRLRGSPRRSASFLDPCVNLGATCGKRSGSRDDPGVVRAGAISDDPQRRPARLTGIAAGGWVAKLATVSASGQPRSLAAAARASPAVSASTTQARTTSQRPVPPGSPTTRQHPSRHNRPTSARPYHSGIRPAGTVMSPHSSEARAAASDARRRAIGCWWRIPATGGSTLESSSRRVRPLRPSAAVLSGQPRTATIAMAAASSVSRQNVSPATSVGCRVRHESLLEVVCTKEAGRGGGCGLGRVRLNRRTRRGGGA